MRAEEATQRVLDELRVQAKRRHGQMAEIEVGVLGRHRGYVSKVYSQERRCTTEELLEILDAMGIDAATHFARAFGVLIDPVALLERLEASNPPEPRPKLVERLCSLRRKAGNRGAGETAEPARPPEQSLEQLVAQPLEQQLALLETDVELRKPAFVGLFLDHLDELRFQRTEDVIGLAEVVTRSLPGSELATCADWQRLYCRALGVLGSALRQRERLRAANHALREGLFCGEVWHQRYEEAKLLERLCYMLGDYGVPAETLRVSHLAARTYGELHEPLGIIKVLVNRGQILNQLGRAEEASQTLTEALKHLPSNLRRYQAAAYAAYAQAKQALGEMEAAIQSLEQARQLIDPQEATSMASLLYRQAELAVARAQPREAVDLYLRSLQLLTPGCPYDMAVTSFALCKTLLALGEKDKAQTVAAEMVALLIPLEKNKIAAGALSEFIKTARSGGLSLRLIEETKIKIRRGKPIKNTDYPRRAC